MILTLINVINYAFSIYSFMLIIYILMSWVPSARQSSFGQLLEKLCEPYLGIFRRIIPPIGMIDISPIAALFVLQFVQRGLLIVIIKIYNMTL